MINIITDETMRGMLQATVEKLFDGSQEDFSIVMLEMKDDVGRLATLVGLNKALEIAPEGKPVIMISIMPEGRLANDPRWQAAMGYPNVVFADAIGIYQALPLKLKEAKEAKRPKDELAIELVGKKMVQDELVILSHDLYHVRNGNKDQAPWLERAKKVFGDLPFEELAQKVESGEKPQSSTFSGRYLDGVFCDVEGALVQNGQVNQELKAELETKSQEKPITIWTDGDIKELSPVLRQAGIIWKIVPKCEFAGARVTEAYDDLSPEEFKGKTNIEVLDYHQVSPIEEALEPSREPEFEP